MEELGRLDPSWDLEYRIERTAEELQSNRRISEFLKLARACTLLQFCVELLAKEFEFIKAYIEQKSDLYVVLRNLKGELLFFKYRNRYSPDYHKELKRRLNDFLRYVQARRLRYSLFMTLTLNSSMVYTQSQAKDVIEKSWNSLLTRIRRAYPWAEFVRTTEWQHNGLGCHLHIMLFGIGYIPKDWLMRTWSKVSPSGWSIELEKIKLDFRNEKHALSYITKYIMKQVRYSEDLDVDISSIINGALGAHAFSTSRIPVDLALPANYSNGFWAFVGVIRGDVYRRGIDAVLAHLGIC